MRKLKQKIKNESLRKRFRRKLTIRNKIVGSAERPRVCTIISNKHIQVQVVDDLENKTILSVQTFGKNAVAGAQRNVEGAKVLGAELAKKLKAKGIESAAYDRNGRKYHGVVAALAEALRENGIRV